MLAKLFVTKDPRRQILALASCLGVYLGATLFAGAPLDAQAGNVLISPKRVVFAGRDRGAEVSLVNRGERAITYRIELVERRMSPKGALVALAEPGPDSARGLVRYAPRQITVAPGTTQKIRLALRKPADLASGEYRSHLLARALPPEKDGADIESLERENGLSVRLTPIPSIAIPLIVRHGELHAGADLSELDLVSEVPLGGSRGDDTVVAQIAFRLHRTGEPSIYGDLTATLLASDGSETVVGLAKGVGIYPPLDHVERRMALHLPEGTALDGRLRLSFLSRPEDDGGGEPLAAHAELELP